jgi:cell wall-associated NlpC family hydrolase
MIDCRLPKEAYGKLFQGVRMSILKFIGIPYVIGGESFDGADCYGIAKLYSKHMLHKELPSYMYSETNNEAIAELAIKMANHGLGEGWTKVKQPSHGDIVTFRIMGLEIHCGIMLNEKEFLHSLKGRMSCIEELTHINWQNRLTGVYRWKS